MGWTEDELRQHLQKRKSAHTGIPRAPHAPARHQTAGFDPFLALLEAHGLPAPQTEFRFLTDRQFKADYAWLEPRKLIVERQGGLFSKDIRAQRAHAMPLKILRDYEKSNLAQCAGFIYLQYTPEQLDSGKAIETIKILLGF